MMPLLAAIVERVRTWLGWPKPIDQPIWRGGDGDGGDSAAAECTEDSGA